MIKDPKIGDHVYYLSLHHRRVSSHHIKAIDYEGKRPKCILTDIFGYIGINDLYKTKEKAEIALKHWLRDCLETLA